MRTSIFISLLLAGCASRAIPERVATTDDSSRPAHDCQGLPTSDSRHVTALLPGAGGSECVALVEEKLSAIRSEPGAWVRREGRWDYTPLGDFADGAAWQRSVVDGDVILAVLDNVIESPGWELRVVASIDGGRSWSERGQLRKPYYFALTHTLAMEDGRGTISVDLDDDYGAGVAPGRYWYQTDDGGRTWQGPSRATAQR